MGGKSGLDGQNILVTGGSGGIGAAIIRRLATEGARPIIHYGRDEASARALLTEIGDRGFVLQADLSQPQGATDLFATAIGLAGRIHAVVNNAGIRTEIDVDAPLDAWQSAWQREFQVDLFAAADICRAAIAHFKTQGGGRIINMGSRAGQRGYVADCMPYGAAKAALMNLTKTIARNFGAEEIYAINIAPGWVRTDMADQFIAKNGLDAAVQEIPIKAMAETDEIAELVAFALQPSQRSLNGATLDVNGGSYVR
jgi:NAD(P)-dependent dehydrogenase (short-subunit alcohol dehydrogenase family)